MRLAQRFDLHGRFERGESGFSAARLLLVPIVSIIAAIAPSSAENIDPASDGSQYAYSENAGWINAEPSGNGGPGAHVADFELTGFLWGENIGWISLSCKNDSTCDTTTYGVRNDGAGNLSGFAWSENFGWINFAPSSSGVAVDVSSGEFSGRAWAENVGWVTFASSGASPYKVKSGWSCDPPPAVPAGPPSLTVEKSGVDALLSWPALSGATGYDIVRGDISSLTSSGGDFTTATEDCSGENHTDTSATIAGEPLAGAALWFAVRGVNCGGSGTYDSGGAEQNGSRDAEIDAAAAACS